MDKGKWTVVGTIVGVILSVVGALVGVQFEGVKEGICGAPQTEVAK